LSMNFRGDVSEVTLIQGETPMTLVLNQANGWMVVDDVLMPALDRPTSLKSNLEVMLAVHAFANAIHRQDLDAMIHWSADGLDRIAWRQFAEVPDLVQQVVRPILSEVIGIEPGDAYTLVRTSNGSVRAEVKLVREGENFVIHDVSLTSLEVPGQVFELLPTLRQMIASGEIGLMNKKTGQIQPFSGVSHEPPTIRRASFEPVEMTESALPARE